MAMSLMSADNLRNNLSNPARTYLWEVMFTNPIGGGDTEILELRCQSAVIPGRAVGEILIPFKNTPGIKYPGKPTLSHTWTAMFVEGTDGKVFDALQAWSEAINSLKTGVGGLDPTIKTDIYLRLIDPPGNVYKCIKLVGCYLQNVDEVPVAYEDESIIMYSGTFSYDYWEPTS